MKRIIAIVLAAAILCSVFVFSTAGAAEEAVNPQKLLHLGLIKDGDVLTQDVTRGKFAMMMVTFMGSDFALNTTYETTPFIDVAPEAEYASAVKFLYETGYILGAGDYRFEPERIITAQEAATIILRVLGYTPSDASGGYFSLGKKLKIVDAGKGAEDALKVQDVYIMFENTLDAEVLVKNYTDTSYELVRGENFLAEFHNIYEYNGIIDATKTASLTETYGLEDDKISINEKTFDIDSHEWDGYLGYEVNYWVREYDSKETVVYIEPSVSNRVTEIFREDIEFMDNGEISYYDKSDKERIDKYDNPFVIYNRELVTGYGKLETLLPAQGRVVLLDNSGDKKADVIFIYAYRNAWVQSVKVDEFIVYTYNTKDNLDLTNALIYDKDGNSMTFADITPGDVLTLEESKNADSESGVVAYISRDKIEGTVEKVVEDTYTIAGTKYELAKDFYGDITLGMNGIFYLDKYGCIAVGEKNALADGFVYGVLYATANSGGFGGVMMRIFTAEGEFVEFDCAENLKINDNTCEPFNVATINSKLASGDIIRYKLNDKGEIKEIQAAKNEYADFCLLDEGDDFRYRNYVFNGRFAMRPGAVMFGVPSNPMDENKYYILRDSDFEMGVVLSYAYKAYYVPQSGIRLADAVVVYDLGASEIANNDTPMMIINDIWQTYDSVNETVKNCVVGYSQGAEVSYLLGDDSEVQRLITDKGITLSRGDIILPILDKEGCMTGCREIYDADGVNDEASLIPYEVVDTYTSKFDTENKWIYAYITDTDDTYVAYETRMGTAESYTTTEGIVRYNQNTTVINYDAADKENTKVESVGALKKGDICVMHHRTGVVRQIYVIGEE